MHRFILGLVFVFHATSATAMEAIKGMQEVFTFTPDTGSVIDSTDISTNGQYYFVKGRADFNPPLFFYIYDLASATKEMIYRYGYHHEEWPGIIAPNLDTAVRTDAQPYAAQFRLKISHLVSKRPAIEKEISSTSEEVFGLRNNKFKSYFTPDNQHWILFTQGKVKVINLLDGEVKHVVSFPKGYFNAFEIQLSTDGKRAIDYDGITLTSIDIENGSYSQVKYPSQTEKHDFREFDIESNLYIQREGDDLEVKESGTNKTVYVEKGYGKEPIGYSPDRISFGNGKLVIFKRNHKEKSRLVNLRTGQISILDSDLSDDGLSVSKDHSLMLAFKANGGVSLIDLNSGLERFTFHRDIIGSDDDRSAISNNNKFLYTIIDGHLQVLNTSSGKLVGSLTNVSNAEFSGESRFIIVQLQNSAVRIFKLEK